MQDVLAEVQLGFRTGRWARDAIGMLTVISERTLGMAEELWACFMDWEEVFDHLTGSN